VDAGAGLDVLEKRLFCFCQDLNLWSSSVYPSHCTIVLTMLPDADLKIIQ
jgi:hypothetical protein